MQPFMRKETPADYDKVYALLQLAFGRKAEAELVVSLRNDNAFDENLSIVAEYEDAVAGYLLFTKASICQNKQQVVGCLALAPLAVHPYYQLQGIGSQLMLYGLSVAATAGYGAAVVQGHNRFYSRFGFLPAVNRNIRSPFAVADENFMAAELKEGALRKVSGVVVYPAPFMNPVL